MRTALLIPLLVMYCGVDASAMQNTDAASSADPDTTFYQEVSWSPDGKRLAVSRLDIHLGYRSSIATVNGDGTGYSEIAGGMGDRWTSWSADGSRIAFTSSREGNQDIFVMHADGSSPSPLTSDPAADTHPDWSPDGSSILFVSDRGGSADIFVMDSDGGNQRAIATTAEEDWNPRWSPDGKWIAYFGTAPTGEDSVYVMSSDGSIKRTIAPGLWPSWSPDGSEILYSVDDDIYSVSVDEGEPRMLIEDAFFGRWSPDGSSIAFVRTTWRVPEGWPSTSDVYVVRVGATDERKLTGPSDRN